MKRRRARRDNADSPAPAPADAGVQAETDALYRWPSFGPPGYLGQLTDEYQQALAEERRGLTRAECRFYHSIDVPGVGEIKGPWDLRGHEPVYLGDVDLKGTRVLEFGPSSGYSPTGWRSRAPRGRVRRRLGRDHRSLARTGQRDAQAAPRSRQDDERSANSWWYLHRAFESPAKVVYGNIYDLPGDIGEYDVAVFGAICLHLHDPIKALEQAARRSRHDRRHRGGRSGRTR